MDETRAVAKASTRLAGAFVLALLCSCTRYAYQPLPGSREAMAERPPPGMVATKFVSADARTFDVRHGNAWNCRTPCTQLVRADESVVLTDARGESVVLRSLGVEAALARRAVVVSEGRSRGKYVNGLVFTTLGGMGVVVATTFTAVGCSNTAERGGTCTAGLVTGAVSVPLTAAAIWMLIDSAPKAHVLPIPDELGAAPAE